MFCFLHCKYYSSMCLVEGFWPVRQKIFRHQPSPVASTVKHTSNPLRHGQWRFAKLTQFWNQQFLAWTLIVSQVCVITCTWPTPNRNMFPIDLLDPPEFLGTSGNGRVSSQTIQKGGVKIFKAPRIYWCYKLYTFLCHGQVCWIWGKAPSIVYRVNPYSRHRISIMGWSVPIWSWYPTW